MGRVMVAYETKGGVTREIAEEVARVLGDDGLEADLRDVREKPSVEGYDGFVLGAPVRIKRWSPKMTGFVRRNSRTLRGKPVAVFAIGGSFGPPTGEEAEDPKKVADHEAYGEKCRESAVKRSAPAEPFAFACFPGIMRPDGFPGPIRKAMEQAGPQPDARDWDEIRGWAHEVAERMLH